MGRIRIMNRVCCLNGVHIGVLLLHFTPALQGADYYDRKDNA